MSPKFIVLLALAVAAGVLLLNGCLSSRKSSGSKDAELSFHSFDGGGPEYSVSLADPGLVTYTTRREYAKKNHEELCGAGYQVVFTFTGVRAGVTEMTVTSASPIVSREERHYLVTVAEDLTVTITEKMIDTEIVTETVTETETE